MEQFETIDIEQAYTRWRHGNHIFVDIRDIHSFAAGHVSGAFHLTSDCLRDFILQTNFAQPVMVMCYHGNSSRGAAQYLLEQGFTTVYSIDGGFDAWAKSYPQDIVSNRPHTTL